MTPEFEIVGISKELGQRLTDLLVRANRGDLVSLTIDELRLVQNSMRIIWTAQAGMDVLLSNALFEARTRKEAK